MRGLPGNVGRFDNQHVVLSRLTWILCALCLAFSALTLTSANATQAEDQTVAEANDKSATNAKMRNRGHSTFAANSHSSSDQLAENAHVKKTSGRATRRSLRGATVNNLMNGEDWQAVLAVTENNIGESATQSPDGSPHPVVICAGIIDAPPEVLIDACSDLIASAPPDDTRAAALKTRGAAYLATGKYEEALADFTDALSIIPDDARSLIGRGDAYSALGLNDEALNDYTRVIDSGVSWLLAARARNNRGALYAERGEFELALADYTAAIDHEPTYTQAYFNRALLNDDMGRVAEAQDDYRALIALAPDDDQAIRNLAWLLATTPKNEQRDGAEALILAERALALKNNSDAHAVLAAACAEIGNFPRAIDEQERAINMAEQENAGEDAYDISWMYDALASYQKQKPYRENQAKIKSGLSASPNLSGFTDLIRVGDLNSLHSMIYLSTLLVLFLLIVFSLILNKGFQRRHPEKRSYRWGYFMGFDALLGAIIYGLIATFFILPTEHQYIPSMLKEAHSEVTQNLPIAIAIIWGLLATFYIFMSAAFLRHRHWPWIILLIFYSFVTASLLGAIFFLPSENNALFNFTLDVEGLHRLAQSTWAWFGLVALFTLTQAIYVARRWNQMGAKAMYR